MVPRLPFPANEQCAKAIVPAAGALNDPATKFALVRGAKHKSTPWRLASFSLLANVEDDAPLTNRAHAIRIVVSFIKTEMLGSTGSVRCSQHGSHALAHSANFLPYSLPERTALLVTQSSDEHNRIYPRSPSNVLGGTERAPLLENT